MTAIPITGFPIIRWLSALMLTGSLLMTSSAMAQPSEEDPWEPVNRWIFAFNQKFDVWFMRPVARSYARLVPAPAQKGVSNFLSNLDDVNVMFNNALQGKFSAARSDGGRFVINSTIGVAGFWDVARHLGLEKQNEDFGQTLGAWGLGAGPYFIMPVLGPSTVRDTTGFSIDVMTSPIALSDDPSLRNSLYGMQVLDGRVEALGLDELIQGDAYIFVREAYLQQREYEVRDGREVPNNNTDEDPWSDWD